MATLAWRKMPIYNCQKRRKNLLFLHVPKCGGGSVEKFFRDNGFSEDLRCIDYRLRSYVCSPQHWHAELLAPLINVDAFDGIFSVFRDPVQRIISEYKWKISHPWASLGIDDWYLCCREAYAGNPYILDNHLRPQIEFLLPSTKVFMLEKGLQLLVDYISSSLDLEFDFPVIANQKKGAHMRRINGDPELLRRLDYCTPSAKTKSMIFEDYKKDYEFIERFAMSNIVEF